MSTNDDAYSEAHLDQPAWLKLMCFLEISVDWSNVLL